MAVSARVFDRVLGVVLVSSAGMLEVDGGLMLRARDLDLGRGVLAPSSAGMGEVVGGPMLRA